MAVLIDPRFVVAVAVLGINDRWLKVHHSSWFTGKLSDVAGLVVAATLASIVVFEVPRWRRHAPVIGVGLIGVGFVAMKATRFGADLAEQMWTTLNGGPNRVVVDPTDLVALPALALVPRMFARAAAPRRPSVDAPSVSRAALRQLAVSVSLVAAVVTTTATSCDSGEHADRLVVEGDRLFVLTDTGVTLAVSDDGGATFTSREDPYGELPGDEPAESTVPTLPVPSVTLPENAEVSDARVCLGGRCWTRTDDGLIDDDTGDVEIAPLPVSRKGCDFAGEVTDVVVVPQPGGEPPTLVAAMGNQGVAVRDFNGRWRRIPIAETYLPYDPSFIREFGPTAVTMLVPGFAVVAGIRSGRRRRRSNPSLAGALASLAVGVVITLGSVLWSSGFNGSILEPVGLVGLLAAHALAFPALYFGASVLVRYLGLRHDQSEA